MPKTKPFRELAGPIMADPARRARVETCRRSLDVIIVLGELRCQADLPVAVGDTPRDTHLNGCCIEHEQDILLLVLREYVTALGGELEVKAVFPDRTVSLVPAQR